MARKKKVVEVVEQEMDYPEYRYVAKDEDDVLLVVESNHGADQHKYLFNARARYMPRPIKFSIESIIFDSYSFRNFALTVNETKQLIAELSRMVDYLEEK